MSLKDQLKRHEGLRLKAYKCTAGKITIGYGRNLDDVGITEEMAEQMLEEDIKQATKECQERIHFFETLDSVRQDVLVNMAFNLGISRLLGFKKMLAAMELGNFNQAVFEMLDSRWAVQVGSRATELAQQMKTGEDE